MAVAAIGEVIVEAIKVTAEAAKMGARALAEVGKSMGKASANMARTMVRDFKAGGDATKDVGAEPKAANPTRLHANDVNGVKNPTPEGVSENVGRSPEARGYSLQQASADAHPEKAITGKLKEVSPYDLRQMADDHARDLLKNQQPGEIHPGETHPAENVQANSSGGSNFRDIMNKVQRAQYWTHNFHQAFQGVTNLGQQGANDAQEAAA